jgi:hypothetical protein
MLNPNIARKTGLGAYVRELGKRWDDVNFALRGGKEGAPSPLIKDIPLGKDVLTGEEQFFTRVRTRGTFATIQEMPEFVETLMKDYVKGDFNIDEVVDLLGEKGVPGRQTLRKALRKIERRQTTIDKIKNLSRGRVEDATDTIQKRYGARINHLKRLQQETPAYVHHALSAEAIERLVQSGAGNLRKISSDQFASLLWRKLDQEGMRPLRFEEAEAILKHGKDAVIDGQPLFKRQTLRERILNKPKEAASIFSVDPKAILGTQALKASKAVGQADFLKRAGAIFGTKIGPADLAKEAKALEEGGQLSLDLVKGKVRSRHEQLKDFVFDPEIRDEIDKVFTSAFGSDEGVNNIVKAWDSMTSYWKVWTLGIFPAYHFRNMIGNAWNMHLAGMFRETNMKSSMQTMFEAGQLQRWASQGNVEQLKKMKFTLKAGRTLEGNVTVDGVEFVEMLKRYGVVDQGFFSIESGGKFLGDPTANYGDYPFVRSVHKGGPVLPTAQEAKEFGARLIGKRGAAQSILGPEGALTRHGVLFGRAVENQSKATLFLFAMKHQGKTPIEAMQTAAKYLFDYRDITQTEHVIKKFIPFYTWSRKNIPLQLEQLFLQPNIAQRVPDFGHFVPEGGIPGLPGVGSDEMPPEEDIPRWIRESSPAPSSRTGYLLQTLTTYLT